MKSRHHSLYDSLPQPSNEIPKPMSPWILYPVMLITSLVIFMSISLYLCSLRAQHVSVPLHLIKDYHRAQVYSWFTYTYRGFSLKSALNHNGDENSIQLKSLDKKIVCYYNVPSFKPGTNDLKPVDIHSDLCTHINIAFAKIKNKTINLDKNTIETIKEVVRLKENNKNLKVLLSIGGAGQDGGFSEMVVDHASRKDFIRSIKSLLQTYQLDGIDLDWEFPAISVEHVNARQRQHFSQLLREIHSEFVREHRNYLLSIAAAAPQVIVDAAYDVDQINMFVDYVNVMTYDYHFYTTYTPFTGLNSPLYARPQENYYLATLNINYTMHMYLDKGLSRDKIVIGIPTYGHSFHLVNERNGGIGSPALGYGSAGSLGFVNYPQVCSFFSHNSTATTVMYDRDAKVPYLQRGTEWISFDDRDSVKEKAKFIKSNDLGGAMIYSLNTDDYLGQCLVGGKYIKFPLSRSVKNALQNNNI